ncbi:MAG: hypothetical protein AAF245_03640, partial [Pseudomonadota bacterium]
LNLLSDVSDVVLNLTHGIARCCKVLFEIKEFWACGHSLYSPFTLYETPSRRRNGHNYFTLRQIRPGTKTFVPPV